MIPVETERAFREFVAARAASSRRDPYYAEEIARFELRDDDVLWTPGDVRVAASGCGAILSSERGRARVEVCGLSCEVARRLVESIDGERTVREVRDRAGVDAAAWSVFVERAFGSVVFAPHAVTDLESRVPFVEIVRYPGSPYEVVRSYWENMAAVRRRVERETFADATAEGFVAFLKEIHVLALTGESGRSFYLPASPIAGKEPIGPGELLSTPSVTEESPGGTRFVSGPRVGAAALGGEHFQALLAERLHDPDSLAASRAVADPSGLHFGHVVTARAATDAASAPWFCPPRPTSTLHFDALREHAARALSAAEAGDASGAFPHAARFHWSFVRLHPFGFANQCLAMSIVNHVLRAAQGAGIPHLVLDHLAIRLSREAYERAFVVAVEAWTVADPSPVRRTLELVARKRRAFELLAALAAAPTLDAARRLVDERARDAGLVMLPAVPSDQSQS